MTSAASAELKEEKEEKVILQEKIWKSYERFSNLFMQESVYISSAEAQIIILENKTLWVCLSLPSGSFRQKLEIQKRTLSRYIIKKKIIFIDFHDQKS